MSIEIGIDLPGFQGGVDHHDVSILRISGTSTPESMGTYQVTLDGGDPVIFHHLYGEGWVACAAVAFTGLFIEMNATS